jgi:hypothetical protein
MRPTINCIKLAGASMPPALSERLAIESVHLYYGADKKRDFKGSTYEGRIETDRQGLSFLGISGVVFEADIEFEAADKTSRKVHVHYIITSSVLGMDFSDGYEFSVGDLEEILSGAGPTVDETVGDHMAKFGDTIGETVGSC